jgi:hypothetical protein
MEQREIKLAADSGQQAEKLLEVGGALRLRLEAREGNVRI